MNVSCVCMHTLLGKESLLVKFLCSSISNMYIRKNFTHMNDTHVDCLFRYSLLIGADTAAQSSGVGKREHVYIIRNDLTPDLVDSEGDLGKEFSTMYNDWPMARAQDMFSDLVKVGLMSNMHYMFFSKCLC